MPLSVIPACRMTGSAGGVQHSQMIALRTLTTLAPTAIAAECASCECALMSKDVLLLRPWASNRCPSCLQERLMTKTRQYVKNLQIVVVFMLPESLPGAMQGSSATGKHACVASRL